MNANNDIPRPDINRQVCLALFTDGKEAPCIQQVISVTTSCGFQKIGTAEIVLENQPLPDEQDPIGDTDLFLIGKELEVKAGYDEPSNSLFKGVIVKQALNYSQGQAQLIVTAKHKAYKMTLDRHFRSFEDMSDKDLIEELCSNYGLSAEIDDAPITNEKLIQYNCTDWDFINMRAEANGWLLFCTAEGITAKKPDLDADSVLLVASGESIEEINTEMDGRYAFDTYTAKAWNYTSQEMDEVSEKGDQFDTAQGDLNSGKLSSMSENSVHNITAMSQQENPDALQAWTKAMIMRNNLSRIVGKISITGHAPLQPSDFIRIEGIGKHFDGDTLVSSVVHSINGGLWKTLMDIGFGSTLFVNKYNDIVDRPGMGMLSGVNGLQIAKVEALEGDPLSEERIYIRLMNDENTKLWARVATLDAGNQRGSFFMPEIDDEVIVGFVDGNPNQAVVLGMLHSSQAASPYPLADDNNIKGFVTREKITIELDDEKKALRIETPGGNKILVSDDQKGISLEDQNGNTIVMNDQGVTIESKKALTLKAAQDVSIEGNNVNIKANAQLKATGNASAEISASGNTVVKGAMVQIN